MNGPAPDPFEPVPGTAERAAVVALTALPGCGPRRTHRLLQAHGGSAVAALEHIRRGVVDVDFGLLRPAHDVLIRRWRVAARAVDEAVLLDRQLAIGGVLIAGDPGWPRRLADDPEPPVVLYATGADTSVLAAPTSVAIVGTRRCTNLGAAVARDLGAGLAERGIAVVSGLALGIDAAAHRGALSVPGPTVGVAATGLDVRYPATNASLWQAVADHGLIVSEAPMGIGPERWRFPARNRIIAALSDLVVVVESDLRGGSMYTVAEAEARQRPVAAVPGPVRGGRSGGTNRLIAEGCTPVHDIDDLLVALALVGGRGGGATPGQGTPASERLQPSDHDDRPSRPRRPAHRTPPPHRLEVGHREGSDNLPTDDLGRRVVGWLSTVPATPDQLAVEFADVVEDLAATLLDLELSGRISRVEGGFVRVVV